MTEYINSKKLTGIPRGRDSINKEHATMTTRTACRAILAGAAALPAVAIMPAAAFSSPAADPIFAAIDGHRKSATASFEIYSALDNAEAELKAKHGHRPYELITWRDYYIGGSEIDQRREALLREAGADRKQIERKYLDAKARERAQIRAGVEWDNVTGTAPLREQFDRANDAENTATTTMATTRPRTPAGAAALITYVLENMENGDSEWHRIALATTAAALQSMSV
jgi:hypothetical protein